MNTQFGWSWATKHECNDDYTYTAPVASYQANAFGLHDTLGNAQEWVDDCFNENYYGAPINGDSWLAGTCNMRVIRGGDWFSSPKSMRIALRNRAGALLRDATTGFRPARIFE